MPVVSPWLHLGSPAQRRLRLLDIVQLNVTPPTSRAPLAHDADSAVFRLADLQRTLIRSIPSTK